MLLKKGAAHPIVIGSTRPEVLAKHGINMKKTFVYFDECHATGTDIPQEDVINLISIGKDLTRRTFFQGALYRLRQLFGSQDLEYVALETTIPFLLGKGTTLLDFIRSGIKNQAIRKSRETYQSFQQKIDQACKATIFALILKMPTATQAAQIFEQFQNFFIKRSNFNPYEDWGRPNTEVKTLQRLCSYAQSQLDIFWTLTTDQQIKDDMSAQLKHILSEASQSPYLPKTTPQKVAGNLEMRRELFVNTDVETAEEQEVQQEVQQEIQTELNFYHKGENDLDYKPTDPWTEEVSRKSKFSKYRSCRPNNTKPPKIYTISNVLEAYPHKHPYHLLFDDSKDRVRISSNLAFTRRKLDSVFSTFQKPAHQILIIQKENRLQAVMVDLRGPPFNKYVEKNPRKDMWLVLPNGNEISAHPHATLTEDEEKDLKRILWTVNFFNGEVTYLDTQEEFSTDIIAEGNGELRTRFLSLLVQYNETSRLILQKSAVLQGRYQNSLIHLMVCKERQSELADKKGWLQKLTVDQLPNLRKPISTLFPTCMLIK